MYLTHSGKTKAAIAYLAANSARMGNFNFRPDAAGRTPSAVHPYLQEVTTIPSISIPKGKTAVAAASWQSRCNCSTVISLYHHIAEPALAHVYPQFSRPDPICT